MSNATFCLRISASRFVDIARSANNQDSLQQERGLAASHPSNTVNDLSG